MLLKPANFYATCMTCCKSNRQFFPSPPHTCKLDDSLNLIFFSKTETTFKRSSLHCTFSKKIFKKSSYPYLPKVSSGELSVLNLLEYPIDPVESSRSRYQISRDAITPDTLTFYTLLRISTHRDSQYYIQYLYVV